MSTPGLLIETLDGRVIPRILPPTQGVTGARTEAEAMAQRVVDLVEQFCQYQRKQRGKTERGVSTYRWMLEQFLRFVRAHEGRLARVEDLRIETLQAWLDDMAASDLSINTLRCRQAAVSSLCNWLVKRNVLVVNPVTKMDRPPPSGRPRRNPARASWMR